MGVELVVSLHTCTIRLNERTRERKYLDDIYIIDTTTTTTTTTATFK
jgi:hypothetical protein